MKYFFDEHDGVLSPSRSGVAPLTTHVRTAMSACAVLTTTLGRTDCRSRFTERLPAGTAINGAKTVTPTRTGPPISLPPSANALARYNHRAVSTTTRATTAITASHQAARLDTPTRAEREPGDWAFVTLFAVTDAPRLSDAGTMVTGVVVQRTPAFNSRPERRLSRNGDDRPSLIHRSISRPQIGIGTDVGSLKNRSFCPCLLCAESHLSFRAGCCSRGVERGWWAMPA